MTKTTTLTLDTFDVRHLASAMVESAGDARAMGHFGRAYTNFTLAAQLWDAAGQPSYAATYRDSAEAMRVAVLSKEG